MEKFFCSRYLSSKVKEDPSECVEAAEEGMGPLQEGKRRMRKRRISGEHTLLYTLLTSGLS